MLTRDLFAAVANDKSAVKEIPLKKMTSRVSPFTVTQVFVTTANTVYGQF